MRHVNAGPPAPAPGWRLALGAAAAAVALQLPIFDRWFGLLDEGYVLSIAADVNRGQMLYRDVYVDAPFPAAFYVLAGWFRVLGTSVLAERVLAVGLYTVLVLASVRLATLVLPRAGAVAFAVLLLCYRIWAFPHWQVYSYSSLAVVLLALAVLVVAIRDGAGALAGAGMLAGAAILSKQDYGVCVTGAVGLYLLARWLPVPAEPRRVGRGIREGTLFGVGVAVVVAPVLAAIAAAGAWPAFVYQTVLSPLASTGGDTYTTLPHVLPLLGQDAHLRDGIGSYLPSILLTLRWEAIARGWAYRETNLWELALKCVYYAPFVVWWTAAVWVGARLATRRPIDRRALLVVAYAGGFLLAFNTPRDWVHLMMIYPPTLLLGCMGVRALALRSPPALRRTLAAGTVVLLGVLVLDTVRLGRELRAAFQWPIGGPRGGFYTDARHGPILEDVARVLGTLPPGVPVPVYPMHPMVGFLADRPTVAGYHVIWPFQPKERDERIIAEIERQRLPAVIYSLSQYSHLANFRESAPRLFDYLVDHYELTTTFSRERFGPLLVGLSRDDGAPDTILPRLAAGRPAGSPAVVVRWPFTTALAVPVATAAAPRDAIVPFAVPAGAERLEFSYAINPERWLNLVDGPFEFTMAIDGVPAFRGLLDPAHALGDRRWAAGTIDVRAYAGRTVALTLAVRGPASLAGDPDLAGWARFRLAETSPPAGPS